MLQIITKNSTIDGRTENSENDLIMTDVYNETADLKIRKNCKYICGLNNDCFKEIFEFKQFQIPKFSKIRRESFRIYIFPPYDSNLLLIHSAKILFEEFLCYIASIFSLWFGFSVFMLIDLTKFVFNNFNLIKAKILVRNTNHYQTNNFRRSIRS